jgi:GNAT superfamily N-acetyltransferase
VSAGEVAARKRSGRASRAYALAAWISASTPIPREVVNTPKIVARARRIRGRGGAAEVRLSRACASGARHRIYADSRHRQRGVGIVDGDIDVQLIHASEEHARLVAARQQVATDERWPALFRRIVERFPDVSLMNGSLYLPTGGQDACHSFTLSLPGAADHRMLWFQVSFLAPYYMIHGSRIIDIVKEPRKDSFRVI